MTRWIVRTLTALGLVIALAPPLSLPALADQPLADVLGVDQVSVSPAANRQGDLFTVRATLTNRGSEPVRDLVFYPAQPAESGAAHPAQVDVTAHSPSPVSLAPGTRARVWVQFRAGSAGRYRYGLLVERAQPDGQFVVAIDPAAHETAPAPLPQAGAALARWLVPLCLAGLATLLAAVLLVARPGPRQAALMAGALATLLLVLELPILVTLAVSLGVPGPWLGWLVYGFIPARWCVAAALAVALGVRGVPIVYGVGLFSLAYLLGAAELVDQTSVAAFWQAVQPGLLLAGLFAGIRIWRSHTFLSRPMAAACALAYLAAAAPWLETYARTVLAAGR